MGFFRYLPKAVSLLPHTGLRLCPQWTIIQTPQFRLGMQRALQTTTPKRNPLLLRAGFFALGRFLRYIGSKVPAPVAFFVSSPLFWGTFSAFITYSIIDESMHVNPITGKKQLLLFPREHVIEMANDAEIGFLEQYRDVIGTPIQLGYRKARKILDRLQRNPALHDIKLRLYYVNLPILNAFVLPNGAVFVFDGIVQMVEHNEHALACILAHEACHVICRHGEEKISRQFVYGIISSFLDAFIGLTGMPLWFEVFVIVPGAILLETAWMSPHSQCNEHEADELGVYMASEACYNPKAAPLVWKQMKMIAEKDLGHEEAAPHFGATHPSHKDREERLTSILDDVLVSSKAHCGEGGTWASYEKIFSAFFRSHESPRDIAILDAQKKDSNLNNRNVK